MKMHLPPLKSWGYAEADPTMDVDGTDTAQKLAILTQLAFGTRVTTGEFPCSGIDKLNLADLIYAHELGYAVKLLAVARIVNRAGLLVKQTQDSTGDPLSPDSFLELHVSPTLVHHGLPLAEVQGPFNAVKVTGDVLGEAWFSGPGAGKLATASAVLADVIDMAVGRSRLTFPTLDFWRDSSPFTLQAHDEITSRFYLRFNALDRPHVLADITDILGRHDISIASIIQHESPETSAEAETVVPVVIMTHRTTEGRIRAAEIDFAGLDSVRPPLVRMSVAE